MNQNKSSQSDNDASIGPVRTAALAVGGMVGGGIYVSLGVVIEAAAQWAWAAFLISGIAAAITAFSYARLTTHYSEGGGVFDFLEEVDRRSWAGNLSWLLIFGYTLTISVYAFAFGNYVVHSFGGSDWMIRLFIVGIVVAMVGINLLGAGKLTSVEVVIVSVNLLILLAVSAVGIAGWDPPALSEDIEAKPPSSAFLGAAAIFVAYEGFQLLTYDYDELDNPEGWFTPVLGFSAVAVVGVYVFVALGMTMIVGAGTVVKNGDVALSVAARQALGLPGLVLMTVAAAFATSAAINSTLFSTAKLARRVARDHELPAWFDHRNANDVPDRAILLIGGCAGALALIGSLGPLVESASLVFVGTFACVNLIAAREPAVGSWLPWTGFALSVLIGLVLVGRLAVQTPLALAAVLAVAAALVFVHSRLLKGDGTD